MNIRMRLAVAAIAASVVIAAVSGTAALASANPARTTPRAAASGYVAGHASRHRSAGFTWHTLRLRNGWKALNARDYRAPSYAVKNGVLYLSGILTAPRHATSPVFAFLPRGARPRHYLWITYYNFGGGGTNLISNMEIEPDGSMSAYANGGPILHPSLQAISFPLSS